MDVRLLITIVGYSLTTVLILSQAIFVLLKNPKSPLYIVFFLMSVSASFFQVSHVIGISVHDSALSRSVFTFNLANIFMGVFLAHWILLLMGKEKKFRTFIVVIYAVGIATSLFFIKNPSLFLLTSAPKMYLPNYYVAGPLDFLMRFSFVGLIPGIVVVALLREYWKSTDPILKNRYRYVFFGVFWATLFGWMAVPLLYGIPFDPVWSIFFGFYTVPFTMAILKYDLMDVKVVAKQAFVYGVSVAVIGFFIGLLSFSNNWITETFPLVPSWALPLFSALITVGIAFSVWNKIKESEVLKYEFVNIMTHKFRTPLTHIKWSSDALLQTNLSKEARQEIENIEHSNARLVELTNALVHLSETDRASVRFYHLEKVSLILLVEEIRDRYQNSIQRKNAHFNVFVDAATPPVFVDRERLRFVIETLLDNAFAYIEQNGTVNLSVESSRNGVKVSVEDSGIGIPKKDLPYIFSKFYRSSEAKRLDTEGVGIGLFMSKAVIERFGGKMWVESDGEGRGSTFIFTLPKAR